MGIEEQRPWGLVLPSDVHRILGAVVTSDVMSLAPPVASSHALGFPEPGPRFKRTLDSLLNDPVTKISPWLSERPNDLETVHRVAESAPTHLTPLLSTLEWGICHGDLSGETWVDDKLTWLRQWKSEHLS